MISYAYKRCDVFGFAQTFEKAVDLFSGAEIASSDLFYIGESEPSLKKFKQIAIVDTHENAFKPTKDHSIFIVELGIQKDFQREVLVKDADDEKYLKALQEKETDKSKLETIDALLHLYSNHDFLKEKELEPIFYENVKSIYPHLNDSEFKVLLLKELKQNGIITTDLEEKSPLKYKTEDYKAIVHSKPFEDIKIIIDSKNIGSSASIYKTSKEDMKQATLGNSTQLEAFSKGLFTVIRGRRSAGFNFGNRLMNHSVLDLLAQNGVVCTPTGSQNNSIDKLVRMFECCKHFSVVFVHPSLMSNAMVAESPCDQVLPEYEMNEGEILAIAFRAMCINFFGYKGIYNEAQKEYEYLI